jgi:porphobilinogen synthase
MSLLQRPRRNRVSENIRNMTSEYHLSLKDIIAPVFVIEGEQKKIAIESMPGHFRFSLDELLTHVEFYYNKGIKAFALFPVIDDSLKNPTALEAINPNGLNQRAISTLKERFPDLTIMSDIALDPYSSDGHDGIVEAATGKILNDQTLEILAQMAVVQAGAGADIVGPSDMMDGRVKVIRNALDSAGFQDVLIMSYTAKYASAFYGPFRDALDSAPKKGDKKTYQMDFRNKREAIRELFSDEAEGADIVMVKPGLSYLDIVAMFRHTTHLPVAVYNVSGEYAMVKAAAQKGWIEEDKIILEMLTSFKRAGANIILTYFYPDLVRILS